jgi:hypothetical protein
MNDRHSQHIQYMVTRSLNISLLLAGLSCLAVPATAGSLDGDRFSLSLGVFVTTRDTETRLDSSLGDGTVTDFEKDLGLDASDSVFRIDGYYRFRERHRVDFSVFDLSRDKSKRIEKSIHWGDTLYSIDTVIKSRSDLEIYKAAYTYSLLQKDKGYLGASIGLYVADTRTSLAEQNIGNAVAGSLTAPLPVIGVRGEYVLSDRWTFRASGEFFFYEVDNVDGSLADLYAGFDYSLRDNLALGFGFNSVIVDIDVAKNDFSGALNWKYSGSLVFLKVDF